jgi:hypothetical protein
MHAAELAINPKAPAISHRLQFGFDFIEYLQASASYSQAAELQLAGRVASAHSPGNSEEVDQSCRFIRHEAPLILYGGIRSLPAALLFPHLVYRKSTQRHGRVADASDGPFALGGVRQSRHFSERGLAPDSCAAKEENVV